MEDSLLSSDDTGFFSGNDELTEEEAELSLSPAPLPLLKLRLVPWPTSTVTVVLNYHKLLAKYLELADQKLGDPFSIDYNELLEVLKLSPVQSALQVASQLLDFAIKVYAKQVQVVHQSTKSQSEELNRQKNNRKRRRDHDEEAAEGNGQQKISSEYDDISQDSGLGSQLSLQSPSSETFDVLHRSKRLRSSRFKASSEGKFISNQDSIIFEANAASADVVSRRKLLHMRFQELASDSFYSDFNIHNVYGSELSSASEATMSSEMDADAEQLFRWIFDNHKRHPLEGIDKLPYFDDGIQSDEEMEDLSGDFESADLSDHHNDESSENNVNPDPESENVQPSELENMPLLQPQENLATINPTESSIPPGKDGLKKRVRREKGPLGPLNRLENFEEMSREVIRSMENFNMSFLLVDRQPDSGCNFPDIETRNSELPDLGCAYDSLQINENDIEPTMMDVDQTIETDLRVPSPLFDQAGTSMAMLQRPPLIDIKAVIKKLEDSAIVELGTKKKEEISFLELIKKSELNVSSKSDRSTVSVAMAFLGALHMAHSQTLYLVPTEDRMFNVTKRRPQIDMPSSPELEYFEKRVKRAIHDCDDKRKRIRINHHFDPSED